MLRRYSLPLVLLAAMVPAVSASAQSGLQYWPSPTSAPAHTQHVQSFHTPHRVLYGQPMYYGNQLRSASVGSVYQGYAARRIATSSYGTRLPVWHDTTHLDYHGPSLVPHGSHFHFQPGHYDVHRTGHWDVYRH